MRVSIKQWVPLLQETLSREGHFQWQVEGNSMTPTLLPGGTIDIREVEGGERLGDLLVFAESEALVVHRLVARRNGLLILQGDNRLVPDAPVAPAQVIGRVERADYHGTLTYSYRFIRGVALFWIARYHWYRGLRFLRRTFAHQWQR